MTSVANETTLWPEHLNEQLTPFEALACSSNSQIPHKYVPFGHKEKLENQAWVAESKCGLTLKNQRKNMHWMYLL